MPWRIRRRRTRARCEADGFVLRVEHSDDFVDVLEGQAGDGGVVFDVVAVFAKILEDELFLDAPRGAVVHEADDALDNAPEGVADNVVKGFAGEGVEGFGDL